MVVLAGLLLVLARLGHGPLAAPQQASLAGLRSWAEVRTPVAIALAMVRLVALGIGGQVLVATGLTAAGAALRVSALVHVGDAISLPAMRPLVRRLAGVSLSAGTLLTPAPHGAAATHRAPVVLERIDPSAAGSPAVLTRISDLSAVPGSATLERLDPGNGSATLTRVDRPRVADAGAASLTRLPDGASPARSVPPTQPAVPAPDRIAPSTPGPLPVHSSTWTVQRGDHLWSIAESTLHDAWHRPPSELEVDRYWSAIVRANRQVEHPDLIFPGQRIQLPPIA
jgi:hypothetical protein